jgi:hypothetical protein
MSLKVGVAVKVVEAKCLGGYRLSVTFSDGHVSVVDFGPFLRSSLNPETRGFVRQERFRRFSLLHGNLVWGDYAMCFPIADLYEGRLARGETVGRMRAVAESRSEYGAQRRKRT